MARTPEQIKADNALEAAIEAALKAYNRNTPGVMLAYIVVAEHAEYNDSGELSDERFNIVTNPMERLSVSEGLLKIGADIIVSETAEDD